MKTMKNFLSSSLIIILAFNIVGTCLGQSKSYDLKRGLLRGSTMLIPGISGGLHEVIQHRYPNFKKRFPKANDRFWNPEVSWEEKYKDPYPGSRMFPVFTDAYHLTNAINSVGLIGSSIFITIGEKRPWWHYAIDFGIGFAFYGMGTNATYEFFK